jgi:mannose-6-phosphate isomerase-like protein (cupin superfamily)
MTERNLAPHLAGSALGSPSNSFVIAEWRDPGGPPGPPRYIAPLHLHNSEDEAWYVLEGVLCVRVGNKVVEAHAGSGVLVPRCTPHTFWNPGPEPVRYLLVMTPNVCRLIDAIHVMPERTRPALQALFKKHDSELLDG